MTPCPIAVVGAGITGTAVAGLLVGRGRAVTLFERAEACRAVGAGILLQPPGQDMLARMGLLEGVAAQSAVIGVLNAERSDGRRLTWLPYGELGEGVHGLGVRRGVLYEALLGRCREAGVTVRAGCEVVGRRMTAEGVFVDFADGGSAGPFGGVVACDGSRSKLREAGGLPFRSAEYEFAAVWYVGPNRAVTDRLYQIVDGPDRLIGLLPTGEETCSFFWGERADRFEALRAAGLDAWRDEVVSLCPEAAETVAAIGSFDDVTFATYRHVTMPRWHDGATVFLGDAAHATSPHLGQGASLGLVDAEAFADAVDGADSFAEACRLYERRRRGTLNYYSLLTRLLTPFFQSDSRVLALGRDTALPVLPRLPWVRGQMLKSMSGR
ncbi:MAG: NAD(P)/FAD-dependent oxidoreductase, partial [Planctomycetota bacterium]